MHRQLHHPLEQAPQVLVSDDGKEGGSEGKGEKRWMPAAFVGFEEKRITAKLTSRKSWKIRKKKENSRRSLNKISRQS